MKVDAVVNTANEEPCIGLGVDSAIYRAAGEQALLEERKKIGHLDEGCAAVTPAFRLPAKYIIHAVSPLYLDGNSGEEEKLRACYRSSLELAVKNGCRSIAFPLIATGSFGYPKEEGMRIAVDEIHAFLLRHDLMIYLVVFDGAAVRLGKNIDPELEAYIDQNYVRERNEEEYGGFPFENMSAALANGAPPKELKERSGRPGLFGRRPDRARKQKKVPDDDRIFENEAPVFGSSVQDAEERSSVDEFDFYEETHSALEERMKHLSDTFQEYLFYLIEEKGLKNADVYKRAIITKQLFSKIKMNPEYHPDKTTAMRLCVGAGLNLDETKDLLARAGYALSPCDKRDIIFSFFIEKEIFDMIEIDIALEEHGLPCFIE